MFGKIKKAITDKLVIGVLIFVIFTSFLVGSVAQALVVSDPVTETNTGILAGTEIRKEVKKSTGAVIALSIMAGLEHFLNKFAYESASYLAAGNFAQGPLWWEDPATYFEDAASGALGESIYSLGNNVEFLKKYGISLCVPPDLKFQLWLQLNLAEQAAPPTPHCDLKQIGKAWEQMNPFSDNFNSQRALSGVGAGFRPGQNDLSLLMAANSATKEVSIKEQIKKTNQAGGQGQGDIKAQTNTAGKATTPNPTIEYVAASVAPPAQTEKTEKKALVLADVATWGNLGAVLGGAGKLFINTLASKLGAKLASKGLIALSEIDWGGSDETAASPEAQVVGGREHAEAAFAIFLKPNLPAIDQWNYISELAAPCASNPSPYCGVMDNSLQTALAQADSGGAVTVKEALEKEYLNGTWFLLPPNSDCPREAYCYENLVKLRQLRILPIGWELAAKASSAADGLTSLQKAVDSFSDENSPYYHLIDPYWLLKAPVAKCGAMAYSADFILEPASDGTGGQRNEYCADVQNCVEEDGAGQCNQGSWGYCLKEKNRWILGGDFCDAQFNTCTTYANSKGQTASYLANTIEKSICSADNVGCRAYAVSSALDKDNKWQWNLGKKIYFDKDAQSCDYSNEGCSQFVRTGFGLVGGSAVSNEKVNLKKAPEYYNCYGEDQAAATQFSSSTFPTWAVNKADLSKIFDSWKPQNKEKCDNFAQVCSYDEVGCEKYTPDNGDLPIPGILTANDQCPSACVGYEAFKQQDTNFEKSPTELAYFIPNTNTAVSCQEPEAGCDEFINLEAQTAGGEGKEYYTALRQCSQIETDGAVYYTWEGSDTAGYQLRSFNLKKGAAGAGEIGNPPAYNTTDAVKLTEYQTNCNSDLYKNKTADPDCREFYDKDGNKSYRLYTKTITVSVADCKKLRKTVSDEVSCNGTSGIWEPTQKICTYLAIPKEGQSCKAAAVGCRAYKGNAGNNFYALPNFPITFENGAVGSDAQQLTGWAGKFSAESTVVGGKSLKVANGHTEITTSLAKGTTYSLSFWAKGLGDGLTVSVKPTDASGAPKAGVGTDIIFNVPLHADWQNYTVGPIVIDWDESAASSTVRFDSVSGKVFYLDNIVAKQMSGNIYVVKNSWKTPPACDNLLGDELGQSQGGSFTNPYRLVPQAMLGCQKYTDRQNQEVAVKSFTSMCREEAVGCEEFVDTHNTNLTEKQTINYACGLTALNATDQPKDCQDNTGKVLCQVAPGKKDCLFSFTGNVAPQAPGGVNIGKSVEDTIYLQADNKVYLVNDKNYYCSSDQLGCSAFGQINYNAKNFAEANASAYLKNQPDIYGQILCEKAGEGCEEFKTTQGASYFKDPAVKNNFCEYRENFTGWTAQNTSGWVQKGAGWCSGNYPTLCYSDADCGSGKTCYDKDTVPCDAKWDVNGIISGGNYKLSLNGDADYNGVVGLCPAEQNGCSEFIDPMDTTPFQASGTPYFVINNSKLDRAFCGNQASLQEGCVLFNETSKGALNWNASSTYAKSEAIALSDKNKNNKVNPVDCGSDGKKDNPDCWAPSTAKDKNDSNTILKVQRDRVCGEWLACKSSMSVRDDAAVGGWKEMCTELAPCAEANSEVTTLTGKCGKWAPDNGNDNVIKNGKLAAADYKSRGVTWGDEDYSGYTLPNAYQISVLSADGKNLANQNPTPSNSAKEIFTGKGTVSESCRGYAQSDMPDKFSDGSTVACSYTKVTYSAQNSEPITKYWPYNQLLGAEGVCSSGFDELSNSKKGLSCVHSGNCTDDRPLNPAESAFVIKEHGVCMLSKQISKSRGWEGYCLDPAALNAAANSGASSATGGAKQSPKNCTLWYPLTTPSGSVSSDHLYASAGYVPPSGSGKYWCVQAKGNSAISTGKEGTATYKYVAYKDARQFYPHTANGYNGNSCSNQGGSEEWKGGQARRTCPGVAYKSNVWCVGADTALTQDKDATGKNIVVNCLYDNSHVNTKEYGDELVTNWVPDVDGPSFHVSEILAIGLQATGKYYDDEDYYDDDWPVEELKVFRNQRLDGIENIKAEGVDGRYWSGPLKRNNDVWVMDIVWMESKRTSQEISYDALSKALCSSKVSTQDGTSFMGFRAVFDKFGYLIQFRTKICDTGTSSSGMQMDMYFYLNEACSGIRQVVDDTSDPAKTSPMGFLAKGRTDKLWQDSKYKLGKDLFADTKLDLQYNQMFAPFGSFSQSQEPAVKDLPGLASDSVGAKSNFGYTQILQKSGLWPIWIAPGGATPLNCEGANNGDCGNIAICNAGPNKGKVCDPTKDDDENGCEQILPAGVCQSTKKICYGKNKSGTEISNYKISCDTHVDCQNLFKNACGKIGATGTCLKVPAISCSKDYDCLAENNALTCDWEAEKHCVGGTQNNSSCENNDKCVGGPYYFKDSCSKEKNVRGLCVGGLNHNLFCGSSLDCPPKKYNDSSGETVEYGICVGAVLDMGKTIPKSQPIAGKPIGQWRLYELFVKSFNTWEWQNPDAATSISGGKYEVVDDLNDHSGNWDAPGTSIKEWKVKPKPPVVQNITVNDQNGATPVSGSGGILNAVLRFNAYADHNQMPIVRIAVDWGDGPDPYVIQGWFKNRKEKCGQLTSDKGNPCATANESCRIHFGDSSDACEQGFYQFTHIYECKSGGAGWNAVTQSCKFIPKVQALDNWGWCNGNIVGGKEEGSWNDNETDPKNDDKRNCYTGLPNTNNPWTLFGGTIEVKP